MTQNPFTAVFDAQRTAIEQSQSSPRRPEAQKTSISAFADAVETSSSLAESNAELTRAHHAYFDALEASSARGRRLPANSRELVDDGFDSGYRGPVAVDRRLPRSARGVRSRLRRVRPELPEVVDTSFDAYLEAHEQVEENVGAVAENVEEAADEFDVSA